MQRRVEMNALDVRLHSRAARPTTAEARAVELLRTRLESFARQLRRVSVRLEQKISGPGKVDQACRVELNLVDVPDAPQILVEGRAPNERAAVDEAAEAAFLAVEEEVARAERRRARSRRTAKVKTTGARSETQTAETAAAELEEAAEVERHHTTPRSVKTANPQRGRHIHKTQRQARATSAREVSATKPSRKSTRKSANRSKRDSNQVRRTKRAVRSPTQRASRSQAQSTRVRAEPSGSRSAGTIVDG